MNDRYRLGGLENDQLLSALARLVARENDSLSDLLAHLAELDERGLCLELGYSSLFAYCTEALGFCKSSAGRRIAAARLCREYPEAFARVASGELQLSVLCALRPHLSVENARELFAACSRKSYEQVEALLAARFPKPDVRDSIRRLPVRAGAPDIGSALVVVESSAAESRARASDASSSPVSGEVESNLAGVTLEPRARLATDRGAVKPLSPARFSVSFTADGEFRELLEEVRALLSHAEPQGELLAVMKRGLEALRGDLLKTRFGVGRKARRGEPQMATTPSVGSRARCTRHVAASVAREVYARDDGRCTFCAGDGRRCNERRFLQMDHVIPHAMGGEATVGNLRLRCRAHNLHVARRHFSKEYVRYAREARRAEGQAGPDS